MGSRIPKRTIRIVMEEGPPGSPRRAQFAVPLRLGYGEQCDLSLGQGNGPGVLLELERAEGPLRLSSPLSPDELQRQVQLSVDGRPLLDLTQELKRGSRVEIVDKQTRQCYRLVRNMSRAMIEDLEA